MSHTNMQPKGCSLFFEALYEGVVKKSTAQALGLYGPPKAVKAAAEDAEDSEEGKNEEATAEASWHPLITTLTELDLSGNLIGTTGVRSLMHVFESGYGGNVLKTLRLGGNKLGDVAIAILCAGAGEIKRHPTR